MKEGCWCNEDPYVVGKNVHVTDVACVSHDGEGGGGLCGFCIK